MPTKCSQVTYRELEYAESELLQQIDRSERIDGIYRQRGGELVLEPRCEAVTPWQGDEFLGYLVRLRRLMESGGCVYGAWVDAELVGLGSLDVSGVNGTPGALKLDMLYVSAGYRGRGIGRTLTGLLAEQALSRGATSLYISATPTRGTVAAYLRMGATVLESPDPELFAREPEDIHLSMSLGCFKTCP